MKTVITLLRKAGLVAGSGAMLMFSAGSGAAPLGLPATPVFLTLGADPNIMLAVDDSGSMDGELLFSTNDGAAWWRTSAGGGCPQGYVGCGTDGSSDVPEAGRANFNHAGGANGTWKKFVYLFPIGTGTGLRVYDDATDDHFAIAPLPQFAWTRSPEFNAAYFDPAENYQPWPGYGSTNFSDAPPTAAPTDPVRGNTTLDLTRERMSATSVNASALCSGSSPGLSANHQFRMYPGMVIPTGTCFRVDGGGSWQIAATDLAITTGSDPAKLQTSATGSGLGIAIRYFPATFYLASGAPLPPGYGYVGAPLTGTGPNGETLSGYEIKPLNFGTAAQYEAAIQSFANWWTYYRKRHAATRGGLGAAFSEIKRTRIGSYRINNRIDVTMRDLDVTADRNAFYSDVYGYVNAGGTPNREAVRHMGNQFNRTGSGAPITHSCQKNFGILFTDGYSSNSEPANVGNVDGMMGSPFADNVENTMADYATDFYLNRLRPDLPAGQVTVPSGCNVANPDPRLDCNRDLHMSFFAVTLGTQGLIYGVDQAATDDPFTYPPVWPTIFPTRHPSAVDDLWHATLNTRGEMLNARTPKEVGDRLAAVLRSIAERTASASSASVNSGSISSETRVYQAKFNSANWTGQLLSFPVNADGSLAPAEWDAADELPAPAFRKIITINGAGNGVPFRWANIDLAQQTALDRGDGRGDERLDYLRGDDTLEGTWFRERPSKLGDIIASSPIYVGDPPFLYPDTLESAAYSAYRLAKTGRQKMVYAGANDGMLHGFDAQTGAEQLAYVPGVTFQHLYRLTEPAYDHRFYVDGSPNMGDVFFGGAWHTVLLGGLNNGGQGIYALDITNPSSFYESNAASIVMWEFTDRDLGYTYSQPAIVRMANGRWAAVFGNGYNSTEADGSASTTGNAILYIVDIQDGSLIRKIDTLTGSNDDPTGADRPNGLATPAAVDLDGDYVVDYVYAGDLFGNLWKFDVRHTSDTTQWKVAYDSGGTPLPLYSARDAGGAAQAITSRPEVGRGPGGTGMIVLFGTGKFLELNDRTAAPPINSFYGIVDRNSGTITDPVSGRIELQQQQITHEGMFDVQGTDIPLRVTSQNPLGPGMRGWYLDLVSPANGFEGEMQVSNSILRNGRIVFTTLIPDPDDCGFGGDSWLMEIDALSGSRLASAPFDLNNDGEFDTDDYVTITLPDGSEVAVPVSGRKSEVGIMPTPGVLAGEGTEFKYTPGTTGEIQITTENPGVGGFGRQSWRQHR